MFAPTAAATASPIHHFNRQHRGGSILTSQVDNGETGGRDETPNCQRGSSQQHPFFKWVTVRNAMMGELRRICLLLLPPHPPEKALSPRGGKVARREWIAHTVRKRYTTKRCALPSLLTFFFSFCTAENHLFGNGDESFFFVR